MLRLAVVILAASLASAASARAADVSFAYHVAELQTEGGRAALHDRMVVAVRGSCMIESRRSLKAFRNEKKCVADLSGSLVEKIGDSALKALHLAAN